MGLPGYIVKKQDPFRNESEELGFFGFNFEDFLVIWYEELLGSLVVCR